MMTTPRQTLDTYRCVFVVLLVLVSDVASSDDLSKITSANNQLALSFFKAIADQSSTENVFLSPISIGGALTMVYLGARGRTREQMTGALHLEPFDGGDDGKELKTAAAALTTALGQHTENVTLRLANRIYGDARYAFNQQFVDDTAACCGAELKTLDFVNDPDASRRQINDWVAERTEQKIRDLLPANSVGTDTGLVVVSAVYFRGLWSSRFDKAETKSQEFRVSPTEGVSVSMMGSVGKKFRYHVAAELQSTVLGLDYGDGSTTMYVILPDRVDGLADVQARLTAGGLDDVLGKMAHATPQPVDVRLPRFKLEESMNVRVVLQQLGVVDLFEMNVADLGGISSEKLFVSDAVHKAYIKVSEPGAEAAAATAVVMVMRSAVDESSVPSFTADHPFIFCIVDNRSTAILFLGRVVRPPPVDD